MKKVQDVSSQKKRLDSSLQKLHRKKSSIKENNISTVKLPNPSTKAKPTPSVELYLQVPSYKSPSRLNDTNSTVLADIGNNLKSPPFLSSHVETLTQSVDEYNLQCADLARAHYAKQTLSKCLYALLTNKETSIQVSQEKSSLTQRNKQRSQLIQIGKVLNSTGQLINGFEMDARVLRLSTDSDKCRSVISDDNNQIANKYNQVSLQLRAFISWKRHHYIHKRKQSKQCSIVMEKSQENSSKNVTLSEVNTDAKEQSKPSQKQKLDSTISSYQTKVEPLASRDPLQSLSRQLFNKLPRPHNNQDLESVNKETSAEKESQSIKKLRQSHLSNYEQFTDDSYLKILSLPFSYDDRLKLKAFTGLKGYLDLQMTRGIVFRNVTLLNKAYRSLIHNYRQTKSEQLLQRCIKRLQTKTLRRVFNKFVGFVSKEQRVREFKERSARKSVHKVFSVISENVDVSSEVQNKLDLLRKRNCFQNMRIFCLEAKMKLVWHMQIYDKMSLFLKRRVLKILFNNVQVSKRIEKLRVISAKMRDSQIIRHCLKTWQVQSQLNVFKHKNYHRFLKRFFEPWLRESIKRVHSKKNILIQRARSMNERTFTCFKLFTQQSLRKKERFLGLFRLRAANLQRVAFREGLLVYHRQYRLKKNLNLVACIFQASRLYKETLRQFKAYVRLRRRANQTRQKHHYLLGVGTIRSWAVFAQLTRKMRKFTHRQETKLRYTFLQKLKKNFALKKFERAKLNLVLDLYSKRILKKSLLKLKTEVQQTRELTDLTKRMVHQRCLQTKRIVLKSLRFWLQTRYRQNQIVAEVESRMSLRIKFQVLTAFISNRVFQCQVKRTQPFQQKRNGRILEETFTYLRLYSIKKKNDQLCIQSMQSIRNSRTYSQVLDVLVNYTRQHKQNAFIKQKTDKMLRFQLIKKAMQGFFLKRLQKAQEAQLTLEIYTKRREAIFSRWLSFVHEELPKVKIAKAHFFQSRFTALRRYVNSKQQARTTRRYIRQITIKNITNNSISQAIYWLYLNSQAKIHTRSKVKLSYRIWKSRLYQKWVEALPQLKRINHNSRLAQRFRNRKLVYKAMETLYVVSQIRKNHLQIIAAFRQRERTRILSLCLASLIDFSSETKLKVLSFVERMKPVILRSKAVAFGKWIAAHAYMIKVEMADQLYLQRNGFEKKQFIWQILRHETDKGITRKRKNQKTVRHYHHFVMRRVFSRLLELRNHKLHEKLSINRLTTKTNKRIRRNVYVALKNFWETHSATRKCLESIQNIQRRRILRTVMNQLIENKITAQKVQLTRMKSCNGLAISTFKNWRFAHAFSRKISKMVSLFQRESDSRFVFSVLPSIHRYGNIKCLSESLAIRRNNRLVRSVFTAFIQKSMLSKLMQALIMQNHQSRMAKVFQEFRRVTRILIVHRQLITTQVDIQNQEDKLELKRAVFQEIKSLLYKRRTRDWARHKFMITTMKNVFHDFRQVTLKIKTLKSNFQFYQSETRGKYFSLWMTARQLHQREKSINQVLGLSIKNKVFKALKMHKDRSGAIRQFRKVWSVKRLQFLGLRGFQQHSSIQKFQNYVLWHISSKHDRIVQRDALLLFAQGCKESRLERSLQTYYNHRLTNKVVKAWRNEVEISNRMRLNLIKLRSNLKQNPALGKPLIVLKNLQLHKAFQSFKEKAQRLRFLRNQARLSAYAFYLRLLRKAFYGLRLNAADKFQNYKSRQIKRLVIKRRWFENLKLAVANKKEERIKASQAAIFRFLSLQRKALKSMVVYFTQRCRLKIQNNFAMALYYKHLLTKGFISLHSNRITSKQSCRVKPSYIIQEELPEHEYEQDDTDRQNNMNISRSNRILEKLKNNVTQDSRNNRQFNEEEVTLGPFSKTFAARVPEKSFKTPPNETSTLSNEYVISTTEMGPISSINYLKIKKDLPFTMLQDQKKNSMSSSLIVDEAPSCMTASPLLSSPPTSSKRNLQH